MIDQAQKKLTAATKATKKELDDARESSRAFWEADDNRQAKLDATNALEIAMKSMTDVERAGAKARSEAAAEYSSGLKKLDADIAKTQVSFEESFLGGTPSTSAMAVADELQNRLEKLKAIREEYEKTAAVRVEQRGQTASNAVDTANKAAADGSFGPAALKAMNDYQEKVKDVASSTKNLFTTAFQGMEDALVSFVTTGKGNFSGLVQSIIAGLVRIQIQEAMSSIFSSGSLFGSLAGLFGGSVGGTGTAASSSFSLGSGTSSLEGIKGASFAVGTDYVPYDMMAKIHKGEKITPAGDNPYKNPYTKGSESGGSSGDTYHVIQNFTVGDVATVSMVKQAVAGSEKRIAATAIRGKTYGGTYS